MRGITFYSQLEEEASPLVCGKYSPDQPEQFYENIGCVTRMDLVDEYADDDEMYECVGPSRVLYSPTILHFNEFLSFSFSPFVRFSPFYRGSYRGQAVRLHGRGFKSTRSHGYMIKPVSKSTRFPLHARKRFILACANSSRKREFKITRSVKTL
ncbi:hypothetical protein OS493_026563 [Desmophyllum pertusum]|uniref:Uncharacterized protein n=1 Tax=Desmophyllum pertusum TaxID=174260 RepID=A0A9W9Y9K2_9CNID|nr:hypothetical protein OS493_026563 [Desmophyllum pertusum]